MYNFNVQYSPNVSYLNNKRKFKCDCSVGGQFAKRFYLCSHGQSLYGHDIPLMALLKFHY